MQSHVIEEGLSRRELQDLRNKRTGLAIFQGSWIMAFVCLAVVHWSVRSNSPTWPPEGVGQLDAVIPTLATIALVASSFLVRRAVKAVKRDETTPFLSNWRLTLALGVVFMLVMAFEWASVPFSGQYSNVFRLMVGFHGVHALVIGIYMWRVYRNGQAGQYGSRNFWPVEGGAGLWHFVTIAWLLFFAVLYVF